MVSLRLKKIAKLHPPKTTAQSPKRQPKKRKQRQTSSEEEESDDEVGRSVSHSLKQKCSISRHLTPSDVEEITLQEPDDIEMVSRASSVAIREHEHDEIENEIKVRIEVLCNLKR